MAPITVEDQYKLLISCIRHSNNGRIDFDKVSAECNVPSKGAAAKRYERLMKANGLHQSQVQPTGNGSSASATPRKRKDAKPASAMAATKSMVPEEDDEDDKDDEEEEAPMKLKRARKSKRKVIEEDDEEGDAAVTKKHAGTAGPAPKVGAWKYSLKDTPDMTFEEALDEMEDNEEYNGPAAHKRRRTAHPIGLEAEVKHHFVADKYGNTLKQAFEEVKEEEALISMKKEPEEEA